MHLQNQGPLQIKITGFHVGNIV